MQYSLWTLWGSRRGRCSIPCGTCGAQGVVGAVFPVELVRRGRRSIPCGTCEAQGLVGAVCLVKFVGLKAW